jgi:hypothetical protein
MMWHIIVRQIKTLTMRGRDSSQHVRMLKECTAALLKRLLQQQQQQQQQQEVDTDAPDAECVPHSSAAAAAAAAEPPGKRACIRPAPQQQQQQLWPQVLTQLETDYLYHVVKQDPCGRQGTTYDRQLLEAVVEDVVEKLTGVSLGQPLHWGREVMVAHNTAMISPE